MIEVINSECVSHLKTMPDNSVDSIVTDPPYELGFMGKAWDNTGIAYSVDLWRECLRVLKPGGHLLSFGGSRTYHRMAVAIEDAGFEIRDMIEWMYGSGFPKSLNIGKAVDKLQGNEREVVGTKGLHGYKSKNDGFSRNAGLREDFDLINQLTTGNSAWEGWGTALKPAHEPICMARKPLSEKTVAENVLKYGTGGINIDDCRIELNGDYKCKANGRPSQTGLCDNYNPEQANKADNVGRFPANLIHDGSDEVMGCFPETKTGNFTQSGKSANTQQPTGWRTGNRNEAVYHGDSGSASRFFYCAKTSRTERNNGCDDFPIHPLNWSSGEANPGSFQSDKTNKHSQNFHPTVKPVALMIYLTKLVTPPNGIVLDPFNGSGSTGLACKENGFNYIGIELDTDYCEISRARLSAYKVTDKTQLTLFE